MTNEQIKDIKLALECCADEIDGCPKCPYARKNTADGIAHCRQASLDALQLINEYEQRIENLEIVLEQAKAYIDGLENEKDETLKEFLPNADIS